MLYDNQLLLQQAVHCMNIILLDIIMILVAKKYIMIESIKFRIDYEEKRHLFHCFNS